MLPRGDTRGDGTTSPTHVNIVEIRERNVGPAMMGAGRLLLCLGKGASSDGRWLWRRPVDGPIPFTGSRERNATTMGWGRKIRVWLVLAQIWRYYGVVRRYVSTCQE